VVGDWRRLHNEELLNLYASPYIIIFSRIRPLGLFRFRILFSETYESIGQLIGLLGRGIGRRKASTYTQDNTTQKNADTHPCLEWDSNLWSQCSSGRRQYVPQTAGPLGPAYIFRMVKSGRMTRLEHVTHMGVMRNAYKVFGRKTWWEEELAELGVSGRI
jgi:hypothetical protein